MLNLCGSLMELWIMLAVTLIVAGYALYRHGVERIRPGATSIAAFAPPRIRMFSFFREMVIAGVLVASIGSLRRPHLSKHCGDNQRAAANC
jgi:hypothetical protein